MAGTLNTELLLMAVIDAFKVRFPMLNSLSTDFSDQKARFNQTITAQIASLPTVRDYDATNGYKANAANANDLTNDVSVVLNRHKHVPIKIDAIEADSTERNLMDNKHVVNAAYALGKEAFDYAMSLVLAANFSQSSIYSEANSDLDAIENIRTDLNGVGASPFRRFGVMNSAAFSSLALDSRVASRDYLGQQTTTAYGHLKGVAGFEDIYEYPSMPGNAENLTGFFGTPEAITMASRLPTSNEELAQSLGIQNGRHTVISDPDTGLSMLGIEWQDNATRDVYLTVAWMYGVVAGKQAGITGALTDYAGHRLITA